MSPQAILDPLPIDRSAKATAWDAVQSAQTPEELQASMDDLPLPKAAKAALWDVKSSLWQAQPTAHYKAPTESVAPSPVIQPAETQTPDPPVAAPSSPAPQTTPPAPRSAQPKPQPVANTPDFLKAHNVWKKATTEAATKFMQDHPGTAYEDAERAIAGTTGVEPKIDDFKPLPTPESVVPPPAPEPIEPTKVQKVSQATPIPPSAAIPTEPESPATIALQVSQLGQFGVPVQPSQRKAVMFPGGQGMPDLTTLAGLKITHDEFGNVYAYRPDLITPGEIHRAAKSNKLPEVLGGPLGMGAPDKSAIQGAALAVTGRAPDGTEAQTTVTDLPSLAQTVLATHVATPQGGTLEIRNPQDALASRQAKPIIRPAVAIQPIAVRSSQPRIAPLPPRPGGSPPLGRSTAMLADGLASSAKPQVEDAGTGYSASKLAPEPEPTAQSRWTRAPITFGQSYNAPDANSASTLYNEQGNQAVGIEANFGSDPVANNRMLRHESIHGLLVSGKADYRTVAKDPAVATAAAPIKRIFQKQGYKGDIDRELPAYLGAFSNSKDEWTGGVTPEMRNAYVNAYANALARQDPQTAAKYRRMLVDSSPGTPAASVSLYPGTGVMQADGLPPRGNNGKNNSSNQPAVRQQPNQPGSGPAPNVPQGIGQAPIRRLPGPINGQSLYGEPQPIAGNPGGNSRGATRRVTGSADIPLTPGGRDQAGDLKKKATVPFDQVIHSPSQRSTETAQYFGAPTRALPSLNGWARGQFEGQPADAVRGEMSRLMLNTDEVPAGLSPISGQPGQSWNQMAKPMFRDIATILRSIKPTQRILVVTSGGNLQAIDEWAKAGFPPDGNFNHVGMASRPYWSVTGKMFAQTRDGLQEVQNDEKPGLYFVEHGETAFNNKSKAPISRTDFRQISDFHKAMQAYSDADDSGKRLLFRDGRDKAFAAKYKPEVWTPEAKQIAMQHFKVAPTVRPLYQGKVSAPSPLGNPTPF